MYYCIPGTGIKIFCESFHVVFTSTLPGRNYCNSSQPVGDRTLDFWEVCFQNLPPSFSVGYPGSSPS